MEYTEYLLILETILLIMKIYLNSEKDEDKQKLTINI